MTTTTAYWEVRRHLSPRSRRAVRRTVDRIAAPFVGSLCGAADAGARVAITFDDGPDVLTTPLLVEVLAEEGVRATFFVLVDRATDCPDLVRRVASAGHEVELHGPDHRRLTSVPVAGLTDHLISARARLEDITGQSVRYLRPPFGSQSLRTYRAARRAGLDLVVWSTDVMDWVDQPIDGLAERASRCVGPGDILLLHEVLEPEASRAAPVTTFDRVDAARAVIRRLRVDGRDVTTVGDLLASGRPRRTTWFRP